jgi:hypothetical protein
MLLSVCCLSGYLLLLRKEGNEDWMKKGGKRKTKKQEMARMLYYPLSRQITKFVFLTNVARCGFSKISPITYTPPSPRPPTTNVTNQS